MPLLVVGINHHSAPVGVRERLAVPSYGLPDALRSLRELPGVAEGAVLSTCNRTEVYAAAEDADALADWLAGLHELGRHEFDGHLYAHRDGAVARHLFRVAAGLDSMIVGEPDIQRQVRQALDAAQAAGAAGTLVNKLFQDALQCGKKARTETGIARGTFSVGAAAVELATQIFGDSLAGRTVLVLGAGKMSETTARHLLARGAPAIIVANRTFEKAQTVAARFGGTARRYQDLPELLTVADIVVCSTAAPHPVVTRAAVKDALRVRRGRPLFLVDIAVPRDVEDSVDSLENVYLYNIDHLQEFVAGSHAARQDEIERAASVVDGAVSEFLRWQGTLDAAPLIVAVRDKLEAVRAGEMARLRSRLPGLSDTEWQAVEAATQAMMGKVAHPAIVALKQNAEGRDAVRQAFGVGTSRSIGLPQGGEEPVAGQHTPHREGGPQNWGAGGAFLDTEKVSP